MGAMLGRPFGIILLAGALLVAGLVGIAAFWRVLPRTSNTSPLAAVFVLMWSCTYLVTATLTWRRSRLAPLSFLRRSDYCCYLRRSLPQGASSLSLRSWLSSLSRFSATGILGGHVSRRPVAAEQVVCHGGLVGAGETLTANILSGAGWLLPPVAHSLGRAPRRVLEEDDVGRRVGCWLP